MESQKQIKLFLIEIFKGRNKETLDLDDFTYVNEEVTSEMFLSVSSKTRVTNFVGHDPAP